MFKGIKYLNRAVTYSVEISVKYLNYVDWFFLINDRTEVDFKVHNSDHKRPHFEPPLASTCRIDIKEINHNSSRNCFVSAAVNKKNRLKQYNQAGPLKSTHRTNTKPTFQISTF